MPIELIELAYLAAAVLFILGLKWMSHPRTAVQGNLLGATGMAVAIVTAVASLSVPGHTAANYWMIAAGLIIGAAIGAWLATTVEMTSMPQMVALLNGLGGGASVLVSGGELLIGEHFQIHTLLAIGATGLIGSVTFWGSLVAYAKLEEWEVVRKPLSFPGQQALNIALLLVAVGLAVLMAVMPEWAGTFYVLIIVVASVLGLTLTMPIGGADMPVVIALLNSYSGLAAAATGFVINNNLLIIAGSLVGASGVILTQIMCNAMNRSLVNVLVGFQEAGEATAHDEEVYKGVRRTDPESVAVLLAEARSVVIVPGYGMAVAQCQHAVKEMTRLLESRGATVEFAIHPVAGRMPGHMNVLLAEADIPYEQLKEMDEINPTFAQVDVAIVIGANDVVNPVARTDPKSPIAGMPILDVDKAGTVVVIKRSLSPGFAGIPNPLFAAPNALMLFADAKKGVLDIVSALKQS